jgi:hypothetical protein
MVRNDLANPDQADERLRGSPRGGEAEGVNRGGDPGPDPITPDDHVILGED